MNRQKDFPKFIKIKSVDYAVKFKRGLEEQGYMGLCHYDTKEIWIAAGLSAKDRLATFTHEILHALSHEYDFELGHDIINVVEHPVSDFIRGHFQWLK